MKRRLAAGVMDEKIIKRNLHGLTTNWWIVGRFELFRALFRSRPLPSDARVLEIGPGAGSNVGLWKDERGLVQVLADADLFALSTAMAGSQSSGVLIDACTLPFTSSCFHQILLGDVLEHLVDDKRALNEVVRVLEPGGLLVLTVPAYMFLWGEQDRLAGHQRRYRLRQLRTLVLDSGLEVEHISYFNWIMFPAAVVFKLFMRFLRPGAYSDATSLPGFTNHLLTKIFSLDLAIARRVMVPFGLSILVVAAKPSLKNTESGDRIDNYQD